MQSRAGLAQSTGDKGDRGDEATDVLHIPADLFPVEGFTVA